MILPLNYPFLLSVDPVWAGAVTKRLLVILEALSLWSSSSSSRSDHQGGHGESMESGRVARSSGASERDRDYGGSGGRSPSQSQPASTPLADRRLCVEVSATIKLFISKFSFIRQAFSFRASDLSPLKGADRASRGDGSWDRRDRDLFGRKEETGGRVAADTSGVISSRVLLMRVLRPTATSGTTPSSSVRSISSSISALHPARQVSCHISA
jgi:hypothetical protein